MSPANLGTYTWGAGLLAFGALLLLLLFQARAGARARLLMGACLATALWEASGIWVSLAPARGSVLVHLLLDALRAVAWLAFALDLLPQAGPSLGGWRARRRSRLLACILLLAVLWSLVVSAVLSYRDEAFALTRYTVALGAFAATAVMGLTLAERLYHSATESGRWAVKPLCIGLAAMSAFDLFVFSDALVMRDLNGQIWAIRGFVHALVIPMLLVATARNRQWTVDVAVSRHVVLGSAALLLSGLYMLLVAGAAYFVRLFGGAWSTAIQATLLFASLLGLAVLVLSRTVRASVRLFINKHFYSYRYDYRQEWLKFTALISAGGGGPIADRSIHALADLVESPSGAQWWRAPDDRFRLAGGWNVEVSLPAIAPDDGLLAFLGRTLWVVQVADLAATPERYGTLRVPPWVAALPSAWMLVPLPVGERLEGIVLLARPRTRVDVNWEVQDLLKTAGRQAASVLSQVRLAEALVEAQQFSAFNRMSAFVVHDLKNLVSQLSLMLRNAERHAANPEFQKDMRETIEHVVYRMQRLLQQLRSGTEPVENAAPVDLAAILDAIRAHWSRQGRQLAVVVSGDLWTLGHQDRLERVVGHLVQNGFDAMGGSGEVLVRASREGGQLLLEVRDSGQGMTPEFIRDELFRPFRSTKSTGMGIGAYESQQYIREIGGTIDVESRLGQGTCFRVRLPARARDPEEPRTGHP